MHPGLWQKNTAKGRKGYNLYLNMIFVHVNWYKKRYLKAVLLAGEAVLCFGIEPCTGCSSQNPSKR